MQAEPDKNLTAEQVIAQEQAHVNAQFEQHYAQITGSSDPQQQDLPNYGLALSGGGIRSASFAIGVIQALQSPKLAKENPSVFDKLRYLSTASGGGYAGSALTWYQKQFGYFPFGNNTQTAQPQAQTQAQKSEQDIQNKTLSYIRQNGKYLTPNQLGLSGLTAILVLSILHSVTAYTLLIALLLALVMLLAQSQFFSLIIDPKINPVAKHFIDCTNTSDLMSFPLCTVRLDVFQMTFSFLLLVTALFALSVLVYGLASFFKYWLARHYAFRLQVQKMLGWQLRALLVATGLAALPLICHQIDLLQNSTSLSFASVSTLLGGFISFRQMKSDNKNTAAPGPIENLMSTLVVLAVVLVFMVACYLLAEYMVMTGQTALWFGLFVAALFIFFVNTNQISPHKMYRDRLMEAFLKDPSCVAENSLVQRGGVANDFKMAALESAQHWSPYHLINTNVILNNATHPKFQGRMGDSFILSPLFCGSQATHYIKTSQFIDGELTLATAMSISGAALNPHAGVSGVGKTTNALVSYLLAFCGLRLGYWAFNPGRPGALKKIMRPNYIMPGMASLLNFGHREDSLFVELSDGGHFDNTGIYELIRRRLPVIIFSDGSADAQMNFDDFGNVVQRIRVDFDVRIRFSDIKDFDLDGMQAKQQGPDLNQEPGYQQAHKLSERGYAIGDIHYPRQGNKDAFVGKLVYLKAVLIKNLPRDLYAYRAANPDYPNQATSDQFFDERQFESYRELGYQVGKGLLLDDKAMRLLD